jgi:hypothetical protein
MESVARGGKEVLKGREGRRGLIDGVVELEASGPLDIVC